MPSIMELFSIEQDSGEVKTLSPRRPLNEQQLKVLLKDLLFIKMGLEITVTYSPILRLAHNSITLTKITTDALLSVLKRHDFNCMLVGEFSKTGMYHMHGILETKEGRTVDAIKRKLSKELGRIEIKQVTYPDSYVNYILKDSGVQQELDDPNNTFGTIRQAKTRKIYSDEIIKIQTKKQH